MSFAIFHCVGRCPYGCKHRACVQESYTHKDLKRKLIRALVKPSLKSGAAVYKKNTGADSRVSLKLSQGMTVPRILKTYSKNAIREREAGSPRSEDQARRGLGRRSRRRLREGDERPWPAVEVTRLEQRGPADDQRWSQAAGPQTGVFPKTSTNGRVEAWLGVCSRR